MRTNLLPATTGVLLGIGLSFGSLVMIRAAFDSLFGYAIGFLVLELLLLAVLAVAVHRSRPVEDAPQSTNAIAGIAFGLQITCVVVGLMALIGAVVYGAFWLFALFFGVR